MRKQRKRNRLKDYDYSGYGWYYVTVCTYRHQCFLGEIANRKMVLNKIGKITKKYWGKIPEHFKNIELNDYVIMPNHLHGIVIVNGDGGGVGGKHGCPGNVEGSHGCPENVGGKHGCPGNVEGSHGCPENVGGNHGCSENVGGNHGCPENVRDSDRCPLRKKTKRNIELLPKIISQFKSSVTRTVRQQFNDYGFCWQRSFYDHIIRNEKSLLEIQEYIRTNPVKWDVDKNNPINFKGT